MKGYWNVTVRGSVHRGSKPRAKPGTPKFAIRLKPLDEFRGLVEERNQFIMIPAEEISDRAEGEPVHINAANVAEVISPAGGATVRETMQNNLRAILEHEKTHGRELLPHLITQILATP